MHSTQLRNAVSLRQTLPKARFLAEGDILARSCAADWQACRQGDVYFALTSADDDGHEHAAQAVERGASAVVGERLVPAGIPQVLVRDSRAALAKVCQALAGYPSRELRTIGVAGSSGKTTVAMLLASICEAAEQSAGVMSSLGHSDSLVQASPVAATPTSPEFASWLARMRAAACETAVVEMSTQALAERRVCGIELDAAIVTNIRNDLPAVAWMPGTLQKINQRIFRHLKAEGVAIVNLDDHRCRRMVAELERACLTFAVHADADVTASVIERSLSEQTFLLSAGADLLPVRTRIIGDAHVSSCLAAATAALALGFDADTIVRGLEKVDRLPGRMERLECGQPFAVFLDAVRGPESLSQTVRAIRQATRGRVHVVLAPPFDCDGSRRAFMGRVLERGAHATTLTGRERDLTNDVMDGFERPAKVRTLPDRGEAIAFALATAQAGDAVLLVGDDADTDRELALQSLVGQPARKPAGRSFRVIG